jgi:hypothetical protein
MSVPLCASAGEGGKGCFPSRVGGSRQQWRGVRTDLFSVISAGVIGWQFPLQEEVPVSHSCFSKGLLIVENAG